MISTIRSGEKVWLPLKVALLYKIGRNYAKNKINDEGKKLVDILKFKKWLKVHHYTGGLIN